MFRRSVRIACLVLGLLATAGVAYRTLQDEDALGRERAAAASAQVAVSRTAELLLEVRASLHAYVAPGQGLPFWGKRAQETIESLRQSILDLDRMVNPIGGSLSETLNGIDQLSAAARAATSAATKCNWRETSSSPRSAICSRPPPPRSSRFGTDCFPPTTGKARPSARSEH